MREGWPALASRSRIRVCGVYPAYVDTPTPVNSGNYTGRTLWPVPPVVAPERVARAIVGLARRPRRGRRVGALHLASLPSPVAPEVTGRLMARLGRWRSGVAVRPGRTVPAGGPLPDPGLSTRSVGSSGSVSPMQRSPFVGTLLVDGVLTLAQRVFGDPGDGSMAGDQRFVVRPAAALLADEHPWPYPGTAQFAQVP